MNIKGDAVSNNYKYAVNIYGKITENFENRQAGADGEKNAADYLSGELAKYADEAVVESFNVSPKSYLGWLPISVGMLLAAFILYFYIPLVSAVLAVLAVLPPLWLFVFKQNLLAPLFKEGQSQNIIAKIKPSGEVLRRIVFFANIDNSVNLVGRKGFKSAIVWASVGAFYLFVISIITASLNGVAAQLVTLGNGMEIGLGLILFLPPLLALLKLYKGKASFKKCDGGLDGCVLCVAAAKLVKEERLAANGTEIVILLSGSGEASARGADVFCQLHSGEFFDADTTFIGFKSLSDEANFKICYPKNKSSVGSAVTYVSDAASKIGINMAKATTPFYAVDDAAMLNKNGYKAVYITAERAAQTRDDKAGEICQQKALELAAQIVADSAINF